MSKIIFEDVASAARRLAETGERPSAPKIRRLLGDRGGMATIQKHLDVWRETEEAKELQAPNIPDMPEHLQGDAQTLIQQIWASATATADKDIQNEREKLALDRAEMEEKLSETIAVSEEQESQIESLQDRLQHLESGLEKLRQENTELRTQLASESNEKSILKERCAQLEVAINNAKEHAAGLMREILAERGKHERLSEEKAELNAKVLEQQHINEDLRSQLALSDSKGQELNTAFEKLTAANQDMNNRFSVLTERCAQLESNLTEASTREEKNRVQFDAALKSAEEREAKLLAQIDKLADSVKGSVEAPPNL
jgi:chromosome segregation ATPase